MQGEVGVQLVFIDLRSAFFKNTLATDTAVLLTDWRRETEETQALKSALLDSDPS